MADLPDFEPMKEHNELKRMCDKEIAQKLPFPRDESLKQFLLELGIGSIGVVVPSEDEYLNPRLSWRPTLLDSFDLDAAVINAAYAPGRLLEVPLRPGIAVTPELIRNSGDWFTVPLRISTGDPNRCWYFHSAKYVDGKIMVVGSSQYDQSVVQPRVTQPVSYWRQLLLPLTWKQRMRNRLVGHMSWSF